MLNGDYQHNHGNYNQCGGARVCARNLLYTCFKRNKRPLSVILLQWQVNNSSIVLKSKQKGTSKTREPWLISPIAFLFFFFSLAHCFTLWIFDSVVEISPENVFKTKLSCTSFQMSNPMNEKADE